MRFVFFEVVEDVLQVRCGFGRPANTHQGLSIRSMRASISSSSINSPRSACAMPSRTAARNRAPCSSRRKAPSFTNCSVSVPAWLAIWDNCASCSGVKWTSIPASLGARNGTVNGNKTGNVPSVHTFPTALPGDGGYFLHAQFLKFHHPITGEQIEIEAAVPDGFLLQR